MVIEELECDQCKVRFSIDAGFSIDISESGETNHGAIVIKPRADKNPKTIHLCSPLCVMGRVKQLLEPYEREVAKR